jgi:hypothetical protein
LFKPVEDAECITLTGGVYSPKGLYRRADDNRVYANFGSGYVRLGPKGYTSKPGTSWQDLKFKDGEVDFTNLEGPVWK